MSQIFFYFSLVCLGEKWGEERNISDMKLWGNLGIVKLNGTL